MQLTARSTPGSGALDGAKGDFDKGRGLEKVKGECKSTVNESLSLKYEWLRKISKEARDAAATPVLTVSFVSGDGKAKPDGDWLMIPLSEAKTRGWV